MKSLALPLIALLLVIFGFEMIQIGKQQQISQYQNALAICNTAHNEINGASEEACGAAQDTTHTEYLCSSTGQYCWLEVK